MRTFKLNEYVGLNKDIATSYQFYINERLFSHIDILEEQVHLPNGEVQDLQKDYTDYEWNIKEADGIDIQVLGFGLNGYIGFNEFGTSFLSRTDTVELMPSTREANSLYFSSIQEVTTQTIGMWNALVIESKKILLLVSREEKAKARYQAMNSSLSEEFPATILQLHPEVNVMADE